MTSLHNVCGYIGVSISVSIYIVSTNFFLRVTASQHIDVENQSL